ncbi:hypothetical protein BD311DRAFT_763116 [Dichomitus squalens]|uniref:Uncharacterized protein n=1 Tax=Dichomitus squalens TaxID=114155 RepID=A0A4Q9MJV5_9APHY|nr:hypothetical protein BD311DRAFT_763116 [Dichomitus squalens]
MTPRSNSAYTLSENSATSQAQPFNTLCIQHQSVPRIYAHTAIQLYLKSSLVLQYESCRYTVSQPFNDLPHPSQHITPQLLSVRQLDNIGGCRTNDPPPHMSRRHRLVLLVRLLVADVDDVFVRDRDPRVPLRVGLARRRCARDRRGARARARCVRAHRRGVLPGRSTHYRRSRRRRSGRRLPLPEAEERRARRLAVHMHLRLRPHPCLRLRLHESA